MDKDQIRLHCDWALKINPSLPSFPDSNYSTWYNTKKSDGEAPLTLELWGKWSTPPYLLLAGPFWCEVVAPDSVLSMGKIKRFTNDVYYIDKFDRLNMCKEMTDV